MNMITDNIKTFKTIANENGEYNYEWDIIVPDIKPDVGTIVCADGETTIINREIMQDRAVINGTIKINIIYVPADSDKIVKGIEVLKDFNYVMELPGLRQDMILTVSANVYDITCNVINGRKINVKVKTEFFGEAGEIYDIDCISSLEDEDTFFKSTEILSFDNIYENNNTISINEEIELPTGKPSIGEMLKLDVKTVNKDLRAMTNKILVKGDLEITGIYNDSNESEEVSYFVTNIPFTEIFEAKGVTENSICDSDFSVTNYMYLLKEDSEGEKRILDFSADILIQNKSLQNVKVSALTDAYSLNKDITLKRNQLEFDEIVNRLSGQLNIKGIVDFTNGEEISKIINMNCIPDIKGIIPTDGRVNINGNILCEVLHYCDFNKRMCCSKGEMPFEESIICDNATNNSICDFKCEISKSSFNIVSDNQIELRLQLEYTLRIKKKCSDKIISSLEFKEETEAENIKKGIYVYFCDGNEDLWNIAKKYKTSVDSIVSINGLSEGETVKKGTKLIIV